MAEECGDKDLMRAAGGQTVDEPCKGLTGLQIYCNLPDVHAWRQRVTDLMAMMVTTWNQLWDAEAELPERVHTAPASALRRQWSRVESRIETIPEVPIYGIGDKSARAIAHMTSIVQDQACLIEQMRSYITELGHEPGPLPYVKPSKRLEIDELLQTTGETLNEQLPKIVTGAIIIAGLAATAYVLQPTLTAALTKRRAAPASSAGRVSKKGATKK